MNTKLAVGLAAFALVSMVAIVAPVSDAMVIEHRENAASGAAAETTRSHCGPVPDPIPCCIPATNICLF